jgi:hypothetical protein
MVIGCSPKAGKATPTLPALESSPTVLAPAMVASPTLVPTLTLTPTPQPTLMPTPDLSRCTPNLKFVRDVTIPDGTTISAGENFTKTWEIKNTGTCTWTVQFALTYRQGTIPATVISVPLSETAPGGTAQVSVVMQAPGAPGSYRSKWQLCAGDRCFGSELSTEIVSRAATSAAPAASRKPTVTRTPAP